MKYKVIDILSEEDITDEYPWVITPDGKLYFMDYDSLTGYPTAKYIILNDEE